jgi:hypothetical protein
MLRRVARGRSIRYGALALKSWRLILGRDQSARMATRSWINDRQRARVHEHEHGHEHEYEYEYE